MNEKNGQPLPDIIDDHLEVVFVGFNPGIRSAETAHHYAGRSNRFWKFLYESGLTDKKLAPEEDQKLLEYGYGSINIVNRSTSGADGITKEEYEEGRKLLKEKLATYKPKIACYMGIGVYKEFAQVGRVEERGLQKDSVVPGVLDFVISSPSGRNRTPIEEQLERYKNLKRLVKELKMYSRYQNLLNSKENC